MTAAARTTTPLNQPGTGYAVIAAMLKARSGLVLGPGKSYLLETRLAPLLRREALRDLDHLASRLRPGSPLETEIVEAMTINETMFFRDGKPFESLRRHVLPRLHATRPPTARLRIWSAAAATGQEAYSLAMLADELAPALPGRRIDILGTDIARAPLARARSGRYSQFEVDRGLPADVLARHFTPDGPRSGGPASDGPAAEAGAWRISRAMRDAVTFRQANLLCDLTPLGRFDVVFCRNVLIYFDADTKRRVLDAIARQLRPDGVLYLGGAETVLGLTECLRSLPELGGYSRV